MFSVHTRKYLLVIFCFHLHAVPDVVEGRHHLQVTVLQQTQLVTKGGVFSILFQQNGSLKQTINITQVHDLLILILQGLKEEELLVKMTNSFFWVVASVDSLSLCFPAIPLCPPPSFQAVLTVRRGRKP